MTAPLASVIIPAHNESAVIGRCLGAIASGVQPGELEVIVVCNGCTDNTAERATDAGQAWGVRVMSIPHPSKTGALNLGDRAATTFPRIYLDADVAVPGSALRDIAVFLRNRVEAAAARPPLRYETEHCDGPVRAYYRARSRTPSLMGAVWGAGLYAVNESGRSLWSEFPAHRADDVYAAARVGAQRLHIVGAVPVTVYPPEKTASLIRTLARVHDTSKTTVDETSEGSDAAQDECATWHPRPLTTFLAVVTHNCRRPAHVLDAIIYILITVVARVRARVVKSSDWARDNTTRQTRISTGSGPLRSAPEHGQHKAEE